MGRKAERSYKGEMMKNALLVFGGIIVSGLIAEAMGTSGEVGMIGFLAYLICHIMDERDE